MSHAFVYTELQLSVPFAQAPWRELNPTLLQQPGLLNKTWLSGHLNQSIGGFYEFASLADAQRFVTGYFPSEAAKFGAPQTTRIFDAGVVEAASRGIRSAHFGHRLTHRPGAFVYTELQTSVPFEQVPWAARNSVLLQQPGLLAKTWLSGVHTQTVGGFYAFDSIEHALRFATIDFPVETARRNVAFTTRVFDASVVEEASRPLHSPFVL